MVVLSLLRTYLNEIFLVTFLWSVWWYQQFQRRHSKDPSGRANPSAISRIDIIMFFAVGLFFLAVFGALLFGVGVTEWLEEPDLHWLKKIAMTATVFFIGGLGLHCLRRAGQLLFHRREYRESN